MTKQCEWIYFFFFGIPVKCEVTLHVPENERRASVVGTPALYE